MRVKTVLVSLAVVGAVALLAGCTTGMQRVEEDGVVEIARISGSGIRRIIDIETGVVCYIISDNGISCLPLKDLEKPQTVKTAYAPREKP